MERIFSNLLVLIPIAFVIALRIIGAQNKQKQKQNPNKPVQRSDSGPFPPKFNTTAAKQFNTAGRTGQQPGVKKAPAKKTAQKKKLPQSSPVPTGGLTAQDLSRLSAAQKTPQADVQPTEQQPAIVRLTELQGKFTPLQMGVIWSEILGPPRGD
jgi:hypothetical protein